MHGLPRWVLFLGVVALVAAAACGDDDGDGGGGDAADRRAVEETIKEAGTLGPDDVDRFLEIVTDRFLEEFAETTPEECRQNPEDCIGDPAQEVQVLNVEIDGDRAEAEAAFYDQEGSEFRLRLGLLREDGVWKIDSFAAPRVEIPEGTTAVEVTATEYEFDFDADAIEDGNIAFVLKNEGEEDHELAVARVTEDFDIEDVLAGEGGGEGELPPGVEELMGSTFTQPGESANLVFDEELAPGRYVMVCFVQTDDGESHAALGMHSEFQVP